MVVRGGWRAIGAEAINRRLVLMMTVTGMLDAVSVLAIRGVFVANMTGNVVFLGLALAGEERLSIGLCAGALAAFLVGALAAGRIENRLGQHRGWHLAAGSGLTAACLLVALAYGMAAGSPFVGATRPVMAALLSFSMGLLNASALSLAVPSVTSTTITQTLTGLVAQSHLAAGDPSRQNPRRAGKVLAILVGAVVGGLLVLRYGPLWALVAPIVVIGGVATATALGSRGTGPELWAFPDRRSG